MKAVHESFNQEYEKTSDNSKKAIEKKKKQKQ